MDLEAVKSMKDDWWLEHLRRNTAFDVDSIKAHKDWLIQQAEKVEKYEELLKQFAACDDEPNVRRVALAAQRALNNSTKE